MNMMTMEQLFVKANLNYKDMQINQFYDISDKNIKIKCYNHKTNQNEYQRILSLVRKEDTFVYHLVSITGDILLKCSGAHRVFDVDKNEYVRINEVEQCSLLNVSKEKIKCFVKKTNKIMPIVDMQVENNSNYYSNGVLSHNTTAGGNALKYYDSIRMKLTKIGTIDEGTGDNKEKVSVRIKAETVKNKVFPPFKKSEFIICFGKGIDNEASVIEGIIEKGIVVKKGAWISYNGENIAQGMTKFKELLANNKQLYEEMKKKLQDILHGTTPVEVVDQKIQAEDMTDQQIVQTIQHEQEETVESGQI